MWMWILTNSYFPFYDNYWFCCSLAMFKMKFYFSERLPKNFWKRPNYCRKHLDILSCPEMAFFGENEACQLLSTWLNSHPIYNFLQNSLHPICNSIFVNLEMKAWSKEIVTPVVKQDLNSKEFKLEDFFKWKTFRVVNISSTYHKELFKQHCQHAF